MLYNIKDKDERGISMLFRRKIPRSCSYCVNGTALDEEAVLCTRKGIVPAYKACRKFKYDPCKRIPLKAKTPDFSKFKDEDFSL